MTLGELLSERASVHEDKTFLYFEDRTISYRELDESATRIAAGLHDLGVRKGHNVGVMLPNLPAFVYFFFAIARLGAVNVTINAHLKAEEAQHIIDHSGARLLIVHESFADQALALKQSSRLEQVVVVDGDESSEVIPFTRLLRSGPVESDDRPEPDDPVAVIYTTASSRDPKAVVLSHRNYIANMEQTVHALGITPDDRLMCILPLFHASGQLTTFLAPFYAGGSMILLRRFSSREFLPALSRYRATAFSAVPTIFAILNKLPDSKRYNLSSLRLCLCGSAPLPVDILRSFENKYRTKIVEGYGLTEATCVASVNPIDSQVKIGSIGLPVKGQRMIIADPEGRELSRGKTGEIMIKGPNVMIGYYKDQKATDKALENGWLHTGDMGYRDRDGFYFIVGRKREIIIRGGQNIDPREVEEALMLDERIESAAVLGMHDEIYGERVAAFAVLKADAQADPQSIISSCSTHLADYKCPGEVIILPEMPILNNGRPDKRRLLESYLLGM